MKLSQPLKICLEFSILLRMVVPPNTDWAQEGLAGNKWQQGLNWATHPPNYIEICNLQVFIEIPMSMIDIGKFDSCLAISIHHPSHSLIAERQMPFRSTYVWCCGENAQKKVRKNYYIGNWWKTEVWTFNKRRHVAAPNPKLIPWFSLCEKSGNGTRPVGQYLHKTVTTKKLRLSFGNSQSLVFSQFWQFSVSSLFLDKRTHIQEYLLSLIPWNSLRLQSRHLV